MARTTPRPRPTATQTLTPRTRYCPTGGNARGAAEHPSRPITTLTAVRRLPRQIRHGITAGCPPLRPPSRPAAAGRLALPQHELGLELIALVGPLRPAQHRRGPGSHPELARRRIASAPRTVLQLLEREDELGARSLADPLRLPRVTKTPGRGLRALAGLQPDVGHEGLWGLRACLSAEGLRPPWQPSSRRSRRGWAGPSAAGELPGRAPAAVPWQPPCPGGHTRWVTSPLDAKRPRRSLRPTATPSRP
jgi:hypothetical protein